MHHIFWEVVSDEEFVFKDMTKNCNIYTNLTSTIPI